MSRFVDEAQVEAQLQHPNIVPVYELGQLPAALLTMKQIENGAFQKDPSRSCGVFRERWRIGPDGTTPRSRSNCSADL